MRATWAPIHSPTLVSPRLSQRAMKERLLKRGAHDARPATAADIGYTTHHRIDRSTICRDAAGCQASSHAMHKGRPALYRTAGASARTGSIGQLICYDVAVSQRLAPVVSGLLLGPIAERAGIPAAFQGTAVLLAAALVLLGSAHRFLRVR